MSEVKLVPMVANSGVQLSANEHVWPQVSFDVGLADRVEAVDFDAAAYGEYLRSRGMSNADVAETKVHIANTRSIIHAGNYDETDTKTLQVNIGPLTRPTNANTVLYHETEHRIDDVNGVHLEEDWDLLKVGVASLGCAVVTLACGVLKNNMEALQTAQQLNVIGAVAMLGNIATYRFSSQERRARKAAVITTAPILDFQRR